MLILMNLSRTAAKFAEEHSLINEFRDSRLHKAYVRDYKETLSDLKRDLEGKNFMHAVADASHLRYAALQAARMSTLGMKPNDGIIPNFRYGRSEYLPRGLINRHRHLKAKRMQKKAEKLMNNNSVIK